MESKLEDKLSESNKFLFKGIINQMKELMDKEFEILRKELKQRNQAKDQKAQRHAFGYHQGQKSSFSKTMKKKGVLCHEELCKPVTKPEAAIQSQLSISVQGKCLDPFLIKSNEFIHDVEGESPEKEQKSLPLITDLEQPDSLVLEHVPNPLPKDHQRKHCKEFYLVRTEPNLFMMVSAQVEKCFGLETVKEFCVSKSIFDKMIPVFETIKSEKFFEPKEFLVDKFREFQPSLRVSLFNNTSKAENELVKTFSQEGQNVLCNFWSSNHVLICEKVSEIYKKNYFTFDHTDIIRLSFSKVPFTGFKATLKLTKRTGKREEDNRFKPPDLDQYKHQDVSSFILMKEEPPDAAYKPKPSKNQNGGISLTLSEYIGINLIYSLADKMDLRSNPFQEGGDDMIMDSIRSLKHREELEPVEQHEPEEQLVAEDAFGVEKEYGKDVILTSLVLIHDHQMGMCLIALFFPCQVLSQWVFLTRFLMRQMLHIQITHLLIQTKAWHSEFDPMEILSRPVHFMPLQAQEESKPSAYFAGQEK